MRILIVNPNTTASMTEKIGAAARSVANPGTEVVAVNPGMGPVSIEGYYDEAFSLPGLLEEISKGLKQGFDGFVIACFDDTGLNAARALAKEPVIGICEAAMHTASLVGERMSVITTLKRSVPVIEDLARRYGVAERCRVRAADVPVLALEEPQSDAKERIREQIRLAVGDDGADTIILGCAGMADLANALSDEFQLPVIEGVAAATKVMESLIGLGLKTGKTGGYATPLKKPYSGELARFGPGGDEKP